MAFATSLSMAVSTLGNSHASEHVRCQTPSSTREFFGLPDDVTSMVEYPDNNFLQEMDRLKVNWGAIPPGTDVEAMRQWIATDFVAIPKDCLVHRYVRKKVSAKTKDVEICYGKGLSFKLRMYTPARNREQNRPAVIMYHGGGWIHGDATSDEDFALLFASELDAIILSVNYSLAPENPYPRPLDDCYEALNWTVNHGKEFGIDSSRVVLWGCSAGANLAAGVCIRDSEEHAISRIRQLHLVVPATCSPGYFKEPLKTISGAQSETNPSDVSLGDLSILFEYYAPRNLSDPLVSPLLWKPSTNHPTTHITVAGLDALRDQGIAYALLLRDGGVSVQLEILPGVPHGFTWAKNCHCTRQWTENQIRMLNVALHTDF